MAIGMYNLTDHEGTFLSLLLRIQPATAYQVTKIYEDSPVSNFNTSTGKIYPIIRRLVERRLMSKQMVAGDRRGTEKLLCTAEGEKAVREWVRQIRPDYILLDDPLRTKLQSFGLLSVDEQIGWIVEAKKLLHGKLAELKVYKEEVEAPFKELLHDNAVQSIRTRMDWLDRVLFSINDR
jgi:DNA-binding PadR family transcriptional regulator